MSKARCILWTTPEQAPTLKRILERANIELVGAGCPDQARGGQVASDLGCALIDDLRVGFASTDTDLLLLGDPGLFADQPTDSDLDMIKAAHAQGMTITTLEPIPAMVNGMGGSSFAEAMSTGSLNELTHVLPMTRHTPLIDELGTALETFGPTRSFSLTLGAPHTLGSLGTRVFDAMDLIRSLIGVPNMIDAGYIAPHTGRGLHPLPGQSLRNLHGEFSINLRFADGRCGSMLLSDQVGSSIFQLTLLGSEGHILANTQGFRWFNPAGVEIDCHSIASEDSLDPTERAFVDQLIERCSGVGPHRAPIDYAGVLSMTHSTLLSSRTGQGESPHAVEHLMLSM
ncbi:MAG: hypothetical protein ACWA5W_10770 [Phycisphaerales bacterium]